MDPPVGESARRKQPRGARVVDAGQAIVAIARNAEREAVFAVASEHITHAKVGLAPGRPEIAVTGSIREISPEADGTSGTYQVK